MMMIGGNLTPSSSSSSSSSTKIILEAFPAEIVRRGGAGAEIFPRKTFQVKLLRVHSRIIPKPIPLRSSSTKANIEEEEEEEEAAERSPGIRTVRVRFQLRKECVFGEHFFILGDHPVFGGGLWDPDNALPLNWSDGHVWTLDLDLPVGRLVEFKFILKAKTGEILWQPGPNRAIDTWETNNKTIRICEDWDNAHLQMMMEEDEKQSWDMMPIVAQNVTHPHQSLLTSVPSNGAGEEDVEVLPPPPPIQHISSVVAVENGGNSSADENSNGALTARDEAMFTEEESPVLVPGLFPPSDLDCEDIAHLAVEEVIDQGKAETFPEVDKKEETKGERNEKERVKAVSVFEKSEQEAAVEIMHYNAAAAEEEVQQQQQRLDKTDVLGTPHVLLENDIQWGRRKLYKLLSNFGLF